MEYKHAVLIALLLAMPLVSADSGNLTSQYLSASAQQVKCKTDFMVGVIDSITSTVNNSGSLSSFASALQSDESQLQTYADGGQVDSYRSYLQGTYDPELKSARDAIVQWRLADGRNTTASERQTLRSDYASLRSTFDSCELSAVKDYADAKVTGYQAILAEYQKKADNLSAKGIDTSNLTSLISQAQSTIVTPLQSALDSANDSKGVADAVRSYCLYNGCKNGTNFHFAAKWDIAKLTAIESYVQSKPASANFTSQLGQVTSDLTSASAMLQGIGTSDYQPGQQAQVWDPIKDAANVLTQVIHGMRS